MPKINTEGRVSNAALDPDPAFEESQPVDEPRDASAPVPDEADEKSKAAPQKRTTRK
ncbi:MAG TPA: hypothetical protein VI653_23145 [Steroidobacteraceae bacterium]